jgi:flagellar motility protein MotE (MotC chaperone)
MNTPSPQRAGVAPKPRRARARVLPLLALTFLCAALLRLADGPIAALADSHTSADPALASTPAQPHAAAQALPETPREGADWAIRLAQREAEITAREADVAERLAEVSAIEERIVTHIAELGRAETALAATMAQADIAAEADLSRLVAVFENMRPDEAARLFSEMDEGFAAGFLARLRPEVAAAVLSGIEPRRAYHISAIVAGRNAEVPRR